MSYATLKEYFALFHCGAISKLELSAAICMWQRHGALTK